MREAGLVRGWGTLSLGSEVGCLVNGYGKLVLLAELACLGVWLFPLRGKLPADTMLHKGLNFPSE